MRKYLTIPAHTMTETAPDVPSKSRMGFLQPMIIMKISSKLLEKLASAVSSILISYKVF